VPAVVPPVPPAVWPAPPVAPPVPAAIPPMPPVVPPLRPTVPPEPAALLSRVVEVLPFPLLQPPSISPSTVARAIPITKDEMHFMSIVPRWQTGFTSLQHESNAEGYSTEDPCAFLMSSDRRGGEGDVTTRGLSLAGIPRFHGTFWQRFSREAKVGTGP
jgi:hypothetical protein